MADVVDQFMACPAATLQPRLVESPATATGLTADYGEWAHVAGGASAILQSMIEAWLIPLAVSACLGFAFTCWLLWRRWRRYARQVAAMHQDVVESAEAAAFGKRISRRDLPPELHDLGGDINKLFDALAAKDAQTRQRESLFQGLANTLPDVVLVHRERIIFANRRAADPLGLDAEQLVGRNVTDLVRPAYRSLLRKAISGLAAGEPVDEGYEIQFINGSDSGTWIEARSVPIDYRGQQAILTIGQDISYRKSVEAALGRSKRQAQFTLESIGEGIVTSDTEGRIDYMNAAAEKLTGVLRDEAAGKHLAEIVNLVDEGDRRDLGDPIMRSLTDRRRISMGSRALMIANGGETELSVEMTASPIKGPDGSLGGVVVIMHDVTELRGLAQQMSYQAAHDPLTGLINRREFERRLEASLHSVRDGEASHVMCYLDLDRFKAVNDTCGHMAGDNLLRELSALIKDQVRESDFVARLGGDEFGLLLIGCPLKKARQISDDVIKAVRDYRFVWQDKIFTVGVSIGLVEIGRESGTISEILSAADSACYIAKQHGRGQAHVYSARDEVSARQRGEIQWLGLLQSALKEDRFEIYSQPIIAVSGGMQGGPSVEVLLRMHDDEGQIVMPKHFIKAAERYQLMPKVDRWMVQATLAALGQGAIRLPEGRSCSINLSGQTLGEATFLEFVVDCLDHSQVDPGRVCFEIAENAVMSDLEHARRFVSVLHGMGCEFGLDDFGSGIGSFSSLQDLSVDFLKIDGAYTRDLVADGVNHQVVSAITRLSKTVGFKVIAEQVEDQADFDALREIGVDFVQGYYVQRPEKL
jgi:diguanylate cyclase (GGDEF)-like protein/PAS domain S-box-containing protein